MWYDGGARSRNAIGFTKWITPMVRVVEIEMFKALITFNGIIFADGIGRKPSLVTLSIISYIFASSDVDAVLFPWKYPFAIKFDEIFAFHYVLHPYLRIVSFH